MHLPKANSVSWGVAVRFVLLDGVFDRLFREAVLQLEGDDRQPVDKGAEIERAFCLIQAVMQLPRDAEAIGLVSFGSFIVFRRRCAVKEMGA